MKTVLGIDLGTQSMKAVLYEYQSKELVSVTSSPLDVDRDATGRAEQHSEWWLTALKDCLDQVPVSLRESVQAIGVSGQQHGFVAMDENGEVLAPVKLWCDTSTQAEVDDMLAACGGAEQCIVYTGNTLVTGYTAPKILWLKRHHPDLYDRLAHILLPHDYLNYVLTGAVRMEYGDASGTGLLDVRTRRWSSELLQALDANRDLSACLPPLVDSTQFIGHTTQAFSASYGLPAGIPVSTGGGDNMMGAIGTGNVSPGKLTMSLGSSGTLYAYSDTPVIDENGNIAAFCSSTGGWLPLLCTMNCTIGTELMREPLGVSVEQFDSAIASVPSGCNGLITLPFFNGERTPNLPNAKGCVLGLTSHNCSKGHLLRSTVEGATFALKFGLDELGRLGAQASEIVLTGGGANSGVWRQIVADVCDLPVTLLQQQEGASFGAALQALWVLQRQADPSLTISDITAQHLSRDAALCTEPNPANSELYGGAYADYRHALELLTPLYDN